MSDTKERISDMHNAIDHIGAELKRSQQRQHIWTLLMLAGAQTMKSTSLVVEQADVFLAEYESRWIKEPDQDEQNERSRRAAFARQCAGEAQKDPIEENSEGLK